MASAALKRQYAYTETKVRQAIDTLSMYAANSDLLTDEDETNALVLVLELLKFRDKMERKLNERKP